MGQKRTLVIFSDIEMGSGGPLDDFPHSAFLGELLLDYTRGDFADHRVDVVFNGDCFDFLKTQAKGSWPYHIDREVALCKLEAVLAAHGSLMEAIDLFVSRGAGSNCVHFVAGNHDAELLFPAVRHRLREACGGHEQIAFPGFELAIGPVHIEHGHQFDHLFRMDPERPFISKGPDPLLNLSWAAIAMLSIVMPLHPQLYFYDRLMPRRMLFELVPELRDLFLAMAWRYWTKDFWKAFFIDKDPLLSVNWTMAKEVVRRIAFRNADVAVDSQELVAHAQRREPELHISGHLHELTHRQVGAMRIVQAGAMRDEYHIREGGMAFQPTLKCFVEVTLEEDKVVGLNTRELYGPPRPQDHMLETVFDLVPILHDHLAELGDTSKQAAEAHKQERAEAEAGEKASF